MCKLEKQCLAGSMFTFQSFRRMVGTTFWREIRKVLVPRNETDGKYHCEICGEEFLTSHFLDLHEIYAAEYDVDTHEFHTSAIALKLLCRNCHLAHHQSYLSLLSEESQEVFYEHFAKVNNISVEEARETSTRLVPDIKIVGGKGDERFYREYSLDDVESYRMTLDYNLEDPLLEEKIDKKLKQVIWLKQGEARKFTGRWYCGPMIVVPPRNIKNHLPFLFDAERLRDLRKAHGYSIEEFASILEVPAKKYAKWENEQLIPDLENYYKMIEELNCGEDGLILKEEPIDTFQFN